MPDACSLAESAPRRGSMCEKKPRSIIFVLCFHAWLARASFHASSCRPCSLRWRFARANTLRASPPSGSSAAAAAGVYLDAGAGEGATAGPPQPVRSSANAMNIAKRTLRTEIWRDLWLGLPGAMRSERHLQIHLSDLFAQPHHDFLHAWVTRSVSRLGRRLSRGHRVE
jgi:hypothetical protein